MSTPIVVAIDMGYGHLRPAHALAAQLGAEVLVCDAPPLAGPGEQRLWSIIRSYYEALSRTSQLPLIGGPLRALLDAATDIPSFHPRRDLSSPTLPVHLLRHLAQRGLGKGLVDYLRQRDATLLTTFYAPAVLADVHGYDKIFCVVTDSDVNRVWAPIDPPSSSIRYLVPTQRTRRRLKAYGVPAENIQVTGFPLPHSLLGGPGLETLKHNLAARLVRLDPRGVFREQCAAEVAHFLGPLPASEERAPPHLVFAVGGAGAQAELARRFLPSLAVQIRRQKLRLTLVAGRKPEVAATFRQALAAADLEDAHASGALHILEASDIESYLAQMEQTLASADVLWTKPSEMTFFGALGLPLLMTWPVGVHERYNRRWAIENGVGLKQREVPHAGEWIRELLKDGTLAAAAWSGFMRMPKFGLYEIIDAVRSTSRAARRGGLPERALH